MASRALDSTTAASPATPVATADAAIARVLAAERDARVAVADCAAQAEREIQQARERTRLIAARAGERTARVRAALEAALAARLATIGEQRRALAATGIDAGADLARLTSAVDLLATEMTAANSRSSPAGSAR